VEHPQDWKIREQLAYALLKNGEEKSAIDAFLAVLADNPVASNSLLYLGIAYVKDDQLRNGIAAWNRFLDVGATRQVREVRRLLTLLSIAESHLFAHESLSPNGASGSDSASRRQLAALYYNDLSAEKGLRSVQKSLAAMMLSDFAQVDGLTVVTRLQMEAFLSEMGFPRTGLVETARVAAIGPHLGAEFLLYGTLSTLLKDLRVNTTIALASTGAVKGTFLSAESLDRFYVLQKKVVFSVIERLGYRLPDRTQGHLDPPHTTNFNAFLHFGRGLDALDEGEWEVAKVFFEKAVDEDSGFDLAREALDTCPTGIGIAYEPIVRMGMDPRSRKLVADRMEEIVDGLTAFPR
jgi:TolB-like protein